VIPQSRGGQELEKQTTETLQRPILEHSKNFLYVAMMLLEVQNDL
jgi:hypothetical protein